MVELHDRVLPLNELDDFQVAEGEPDVRGWQVLAADRREIGEVHDLLVDTAAMKVRYLDVDLNDGMAAARTREDRHILIPIGYALLDQNARQVMVSALQTPDIETIPAYRHERITPAYESALEERFTGRRHAPAERDERLTLSEEELVVGKREVTAGAVELEKEVETHHVRQSVPVSHEEVIVERRPAMPGMTTQARIENDEIHIPVHKEELVVEKRVVPKEELIVRKRETVENTTVEADLRREHAEVRRDAGADLHERG